MCVYNSILGALKCAAIEVSLALTIFGVIGLIFFVSLLLEGRKRRKYKFKDKK
jgi:ABC-type enterochelin transport system permease subunit